VDFHHTVLGLHRRGCLVAGAALPVIALLQRVETARVTVAAQTVGEIATGLCTFVCAEPGDTGPTAKRLLERVLGYRVFSDGAGKMNRSLRDVGGGLLLVPQFTLAADTSSGNRPGFSTSASPELARALFEELCAEACALHSPFAAGRFGAHMKVSLVNDGPVTFWLRVAPP
jgi:D-tyrosyl-tRNA(Tyr) deacylase